MTQSLCRLAADVRRVVRTPDRARLTRRALDQISSSTIIAPAWRVNVWLISILALLGSFGCRPVQTQQETKNPLPVRRMSPDSVVLEVTRLDIPIDEVDWHQQLFGELDETSIPIETRRRLAANGMRVAVSSSQLPSMVERLMSRREKWLEEQRMNGIPLPNADGTHQRLQPRMNQPKLFPLGSEHPELEWFLDNDGYISGKRLQKARCMMEITTFPRSDGSVRMHVMPTIEHGHQQQRFARNAHSLVVTNERAREDFESLAVICQLSPGQLLVVTRTAESAGLGHVLFGSINSPGTQGQVLLIRLAQTQLDDRFASERVFAPIETPIY